MSGPARDARWAFARYEAVRRSLPRADFPGNSRPVDGLGALAAGFDVFLLDAFGVLNVGEGAIPGAVDAVRRLQRQGKRVMVLTNAATFPAEAALQKYRALGFDFGPRDVVSSRDALAQGMAETGSLEWGVAATAESRVSALPGRTFLLDDDVRGFVRAGGFVLLSSAGWSARRQEMLVAALRDRPRPVLVGNPDIVAPREDGLSLEPGHFAHQVAQATDVRPNFFGKPFANIYALALARLGRVDRGRVLAVGDTLHTDVLGGAAAGLRTALVTDHGLFAGLDVAPFIARSAIRPDFILPSI